MINDRIVLSSKEILEKEFKIDARGYRLQEVDKFLDVVIHDYNEYNNIIKELAIKNNSLMEEVKVINLGKRCIWIICRGKSMLAQSVMIVVFVLREKIT